VCVAAHVAVCVLHSVCSLCCKVRVAVCVAMRVAACVAVGALQGVCCST